MKKSEDDQSKDRFLINLPPFWAGDMLRRVPSEIGKKEQSPSFKFIDQVRGRELGEYDIVRKLREITDSYDTELLSALLKDTRLYIELYKAELTESIYNSDIQAEILKWEKAERELPLLKPTETKVAYLNREDLDLEKLLFPEEFKPVYNLQHMIEDKMRDQANEINPSPVFKKINWEFSELEIVELGKALCEMKKPKGTSEKDAIQALGNFFNLDIYEKLKTKKLETIKKRQETPDFLEKLSAYLSTWGKK